MSHDELADTRSAVPLIPAITVRDWSMAAIAGVMLILAAWLLVFGGPADGAAGVIAEPPALTLLTPAAGDEIEGPLVVRFRNEDARLLSGPTGWGTGGYHLHLALNGIELMPAPNDIRFVDDAYQWTVPNAPTGELTLRLLWSDERHRPVESGASDEIRVMVR
jgi:hypothetical protein